MDVDVEEEIEAAIAKERAKWEKILENAQKVSEDYGQQVANLTSQLQDLRSRFQELESRRPRVSSEESDKIRELEEALTRTRLECLEREKAAVRRAREEGELALRREREVRSAPPSTHPHRLRALFSILPSELPRGRSVGAAVAAAFCPAATHTARPAGV